jgi:hypothetical protein
VYNLQNIVEWSGNGKNQSYSGKRWSKGYVEALRATTETTYKIDDRFAVRLLNAAEIYTRNLFVYTLLCLLAIPCFSHNQLIAKRLPPPANFVPNA